MSKAGVDELFAQSFTPDGGAEDLPGALRLVLWRLLISSASNLLVGINVRAQLGNGLSDQAEQVRMVVEAERPTEQDLRIRCD